MYIIASYNTSFMFYQNYLKIFWSPVLGIKIPSKSEDLSPLWI
jgi:hypothetical protein